ncbi:unnamed protein product [Leptosia nina]|uniref:Uncharacterized protein n=1 Tax=Leptosia nina TaxID=320188 RepID=A0AAV1JK77_9NEOP
MIRLQLCIAIATFILQLQSVQSYPAYAPDPGVDSESLTHYVYLVRDRNIQIDPDASNYVYLVKDDDKCARKRGRKPPNRDRIGSGVATVEPEMDDNDSPNEKLFFGKSLWKIISKIGKKIGKEIVKGIEYAFKKIPSATIDATPGIVVDQIKSSKQI